MNVASGLVDASRRAGLPFAFMARTVHPDDALIRPAEAAEIAGVSVRTLSRYVLHGRLVAVRTPGGRYRYRRADIVAIATPTTPAA